MKLGIAGIMLLTGCSLPLDGLATEPDAILLEAGVGAPDAQIDRVEKPAQDSGGKSDSAGEAEAGQAEACSLVTHSDGIGQTWQDCLPLGTYDEAQALAACIANGGSPCVQSNCTGAGSAICDKDPVMPGYCSCWTYAGSSAGHVESHACATISVAACGGGATWR
jgi:hypothetical protein